MATAKRLALYFGLIGLGVALTLGTLAALNYAAVPEHFYRVQEGETFGYEAVDGHILMVRYAGREKGEYVFVETQPSGVNHVFRCADPCDVAKEEELLGDRIMTTKSYAAKPNSLIALMVADAAAGRLVIASSGAAP
jgi:hypothetical protein